MPQDLNFKGFFKNREDAMLKLFELIPLKNMTKGNFIVIAISVGGVPIARALARKLLVPFEFLFTEPITAPNNPECQIGMVSETEEIVINDRLVDSFNIKLDYIYGEAHRKYEEKIIKYMYKYRKGGVAVDIADKEVILVDEGVDTGLTLMTSVKTAIKKNAKSVTIAVPVIPYDVWLTFEEIVDKTYTVITPKDFVDVPYYYEELLPVGEDEMDILLKDYLAKDRHGVSD